MELQVSLADLDLSARLDLKDQLAQLADLVEMVSREDLALKEKLELLVSRVDLAEMDNPVLQAGNLDVGPQGPAGSPGFNGAPRKGSAISLAGKELQAKTDYQADQVSQVATFIPFINFKIILFKLQN
jgi:hypothetical protein